MKTYGNMIPINHRERKNPLVKLVQYAAAASLSGAFDLARFVRIFARDRAGMHSHSRETFRVIHISYHTELVFPNCAMKS